MNRRGVIAVHVGPTGRVRELTRKDLSKEPPKRGNLYTRLVGGKSIICL